MVSWSYYLYMANNYTLIQRCLLKRGLQSFSGWMAYRHICEVPKPWDSGSDRSNLSKIFQLYRYSLLRNSLPLQSDINSKISNSRASWFYDETFCSLVNKGPARVCSLALTRRVLYQRAPTTSWNIGADMQYELHEWLPRMAAWSRRLAA